MTTNLKEKFEKEIRPMLKKDLGIKNVNAVPTLEKVVVNIGLGRASQQASFVDKILPQIEKDLATIIGQKASRRGSKKSIAGFKTREGQVIGLAATLRGKRMYDLVDKINKSVFPRVRDFKGIDLKNIDKQGNLNIGLKEHVVFPEVSQDTSLVNFGLQITLVIKNSQKRDDAIALYRQLGFMFKK